MSPASNNKIATLLLNSLPVDEQIQTVRNAVRELDATSDESETALVAALLQQCQDAEARKGLIHHLDSFIVAGSLGPVVSIYNKHSDIRDSLLRLSIQYLSLIPEQIRIAAPKWLAVSVGNDEEANFIDNETSDGSDSLVVALAKTTAYLRFVARAPLNDLRINEVITLFSGCCVLVRSADQKLCTYARDCILELFKVHPSTCSDYLEPLWDSVSALIRSKPGFHQQLGHVLWLRWISSGVSVTRKLLEDPVYWEILRNGLENGDSERRKSSLQVFKISVGLAVDKHGLSTVVSEENRPRTSPETVKQHYARFCTVFETIVLGRYLNQVQECEADLDFLSSSQSVVKALWVLMLLTSALDQNMQDSNRKFIANWIMRSTLPTDDQKAYISFFGKSFLPWAVQGHLFTSSLRHSESHMICMHGERLAGYISRLLSSIGPSDFASNIIDIVLRIILTRQGRNFAYIKIYLLEGLGRAIEGQPDIKLTTTQVESLENASIMTELPEIARDYVYAKCLKLCSSQSETEVREKNVSSQGPGRWIDVQEKVQQLNHRASVQRDGSITSWSSQLSKRDLHERESIKKCLGLVFELQDETQPSSNVASVNARLDDIWNDLEYLEYPKDLLMILPDTVLNNSVLSIATQNDGGKTELAGSVSRIIESLIMLSRSRSYLLSALIRSIRHMCIRYPDQPLPFDLEKLLLQIVNHPPTPTLEVKLEDATATLMNDLGPNFRIFSYEYYFGPRESYGIAGLLDLVSRFRKADVAERIMSELLGRWITQKIPPPSVSPWKNTLQLQVILICIECAIPTTELDQARRLLKDLHHVLAVEPLPRYRYLLEWMIMRVYIHHPLLRSMILAELKTKDHHSNPKFLASLMKIGVRIARSEGSDEEFASHLASVFVPMAASSKVVIRHEAQWQIPLLLDHGKKCSWTSVTGNAAIRELDEFIRSLNRFDDPPLERKIDLFHPVHDHNLTNLVEGPWFGLDDIEQPLCRRTDFEKLLVSDAAELISTSTLPTACMPLGPPISPSAAPSKPSATNSDPSRRILQNIDNISRALGAGPGPTALQTKGDAYLGVERALHPHLLVVSSLVDNNYNLGGLSRVAEIFGAGAMYVQNVGVTGSKEFANVSVTSHLHLPIHALAVAGVPEFLARKRREEGFVVVGIEQTDRSVRLGSPECVLPERCVLVVGSEREGIPALVLSECDVLVEIPQLGLTRSLNVQTAAGIVLCEYAKQHRRKEG